MKYLRYVQPTGNRQTYSITNLNVGDMRFIFEFEYLYFEKQIEGGDWSECLGSGYPNKFRFGSNPEIFFSFGGNPYNATGIDVIDGAVRLTKEGVWYNGNQIITIPSPASNISSGYLCIGGDSQYTGDALVKANTKIGRLKVWLNDRLYADFVPAEDNGIVGFYDEVGQVFYDSDGSQPWIAGPEVASISVSASNTFLAAAGETISIEVSTENAWTLTTSGDTFLTFSSTGDTSGATITATAPNYSGSTAREEIIIFTDTNTSDTAEITIKQKKYSAGQPVYLGGAEVTELYLGDHQINEAYLGDVQVFSSGPFQGLKLSPKSFSFNSGSLSAICKVKSSESWTMTVPAWLTASTLTGDTGETVVTLTTTAQTADTSGVITVTSANYSASASCEYQEYQSVDYVYENSGNYQQSHHLDTGIAHTASTMTVQLKYKSRGGNSDRMVGYQQGDEGCQYDTVDFRIFGYQNGTFDYQYNRQKTSTAINNVGQAYDLTIGDCFCYDNTNETYLVQLTPTGVVPSPNCHIYVDMSYIKVKEVKIMDGNNVLFDGVAAKLENQYGLFDTVGGNFITTTDFTIVGEE